MSKRSEGKKAIKTKELEIGHSTGNSKYIWSKIQGEKKINSNTQSEKPKENPQTSKSKKSKFKRFFSSWIQSSKGEKNNKSINSKIIGKTLKLYGKL